MKFKIYSDGRWSELTGSAPRLEGEVEFVDQGTVRFSGAWSGKTGTIEGDTLVIDDERYERVVK